MGAGLIMGANKDCGDCGVTDDIIMGGLTDIFNGAFNPRGFRTTG
ncbi:hypothetical protein HMPREF9103_03016 [Lentilactobacillus parafarraginis F0439]|uniref:Uncharacterized protein n=1 Tax=Lentilactobacillus parafarraginis F0439 TaxID=797515 RepID=G9ZTD1_9LACO|nr:hypothetical protein HMPREF9103_03016 [Lentilactobacillus parafarraginis F0439]